jgi:hypothetical protein
MDNLPLIVVVVAIIAAGWYLRRGTAKFVIRLRRGIPTVTRGEVAPHVLASIVDVCTQCGVTSGTITAIPTGKKQVRMKFSSDIPQGCQQQIRNLMLAGAFQDIRLSP